MLTIGSHGFGSMGAAIEFGMLHEPNESWLDNRHVGVEQDGKAFRDACFSGSSPDDRNHDLGLPVLGLRRNIHPMPQNAHRVRRGDAYRKDMIQSSLPMSIRRFCSEHLDPPMRKNMRPTHPYKPYRQLLYLEAQAVAARAVGPDPNSDVV